MWLHKFRREGTAQEEAHEQFMLRFVTGLFSASAPGQDPSGEERIKRWEGDLMKALGLFRHAHVRMCFADLVIEHITALAAGPFSSGSGRSFSGSGSSLIDGGGGGAGGAGGGSDRGPGRRTAATAPASGTGEAVCISVASFDYLVATLNAMLRECSNHREFDAAKPFVDLSNVIYCAPAAEVEVALDQVGRQARGIALRHLAPLAAPAALASAAAELGRARTVAGAMGTSLACTQVR